MVPGRILYNMYISNKWFGVTVDIDSIVFRIVYTNNVSTEIFYFVQSYNIPRNIILYLANIC